jgi:hypothetical protein
MTIRRFQWFLLSHILVNFGMSLVPTWVSVRQANEGQHLKEHQSFVIAHGHYLQE